VIHICIPVHDEAATLGPLMWKLKKVFTDPEYRRDFRIVVLDDASTDATAEVLSRYADVLPLEVIHSETRLGYGRAVDRLLRSVVDGCAYPKRDAAVVLQADFTEDPAAVAELTRTIEGGADIVAGRLALEVDGEPTVGEVPRNLRWAHRAAPWILGRAYRDAPVADPLCGFRAYRVIVLKKALREADGAPLCSAREPWAASLELLARLVPHARRTEETDLVHRHALRTRPSRFRALDNLKVLWRLRGGRWWQTQGSNGEAA
jgi:glycosyltransferase involved in cell wall biosynthesis